MNEYLITTNIILAVLFFVALWEWNKSHKKAKEYSNYHNKVKDYIKTLEESEDLNKEMNQLRIDKEKILEDHIRKQDAVMTQLTEENKKLKLQNNHSVSLLKEWLDQAVKFEVEIKNLEQANATQAKSFQTLLNKNNALHRELKLARNPLK